MNMDTVRRNLQHTSDKLALVQETHNNMNNKLAMVQEIHNIMNNELKQTKDSFEQVKKKMESTIKAPDKATHEFIQSSINM
ncbi:hypothetical protein AUEXF2481DRAFT_85482, partial [Aureobasidium subglaciale EXF-2481]